MILGQAAAPVVCGYGMILAVFRDGGPGAAAEPWVETAQETQRFAVISNRSHCVEITNVAQRHCDCKNNSQKR
jgi:hypothetical protein